VLFAAAGQRHAAGDLSGATTLYRQLVAVAPQHAAAHNSLANVLAERGCYAHALEEARAASATAVPELGDAIRATVSEIERAIVGGAVSAQACP
jgi:predicted Zn-dependent protease